MPHLSKILLPALIEDACLDVDFLSVKLTIDVVHNREITLFRPAQNSELQ
jgi:hypothetical protein